jgi:DNA polymerase-3 subunit beta
LISDRIKSPLRVKFGEGKICLSCFTSLGKAYDEMEGQIEGPDVEMGFNNRYLLDALRAAGCDEVTLEISGSLSPMKVVPLSGDGFLFLVLPVRLKNEQ